MKYVTKDNVEVEVLHTVFKSIDNDDLVKFGIERVEFNSCGNNFIGHSYEVELFNGQNARYGDYIVRYPDGTCHVYSEQLFNMLFENQEQFKIKQKYVEVIDILEKLYIRIEKLQDKNGIVFILSKEQYENVLICVNNHIDPRLKSSVSTGCLFEFNGIGILDDKGSVDCYAKIKY